MGSIKDKQSDCDQILNFVSKICAFQVTLQKKYMIHYLHFQYPYIWVILRLIRKIHEKLLYRFESLLVIIMTLLITYEYHV